MKITFTIFLFLVLCAAHPAAAQGIPDGGHASARFVTGKENVDKKPSTEAGLEITLEEGWYTYWRMPGDVGLAPKFDWTGSTNVKQVEVSWPVPSRFTVADMHSFGYGNHVVLPLIITPEDSAKPVALDLKLDIVVCHDICIPETLQVKGEDAVSDPKTLKMAKDSLPQRENSDDIGLNAAVIGKESVVVTAYARGGFRKDADMIVETPTPIFTTPPQIFIDEKDPNKAVLKIPAPEGVDLSKELFGKEATILLLHGGKSIEKNFTF